LRPEYVILAAAKVGGIKANNELPGRVHLRKSPGAEQRCPRAWKHGVKKLLFLGSSCIYPNTCWHAIQEDNCSAAAWSRPTVVRDCEDRRDQNVPGVSQAAWL
jgi:nucleoside-diphosphate-sugar epimerase